VKTGTIGARVGFGNACAQHLPCLPTPEVLGTVMCQVVVNSGTQNASSICDVLKRVTSLLAVSQGGARTAGPLPGSTSGPQIGSSKPSTSLSGLLGGGS
jgi:hypothetical protein